MSKTALVTAHIPKYLEQFACIGPACEDSCCRGGWHIAVDKTAYHRLKDLPNPEHRKIINIHLQRVQDNQGGNSSNFAQLLSENDACGLLEEDSLCYIHRHLGEDYLPDVCSQYPRALAQFKTQGNILNQETASPSCPEILRLLLRSDDAVELVEKKNLKVRRHLGSLIDGPHASIRLDTCLFCYGVITHAVDYTLWQRLMILNLFLDTCARTEEVGHIEKIPDQYKMFIQQEDTCQIFVDYVWDPVLTLEIVVSMFKLRATSAITSKRYLEVLSCIEKHFSRESTQSPAAEEENSPLPKHLRIWKEIIREANRDYWLPWIGSGQESLARVLANEVLRTRLPTRMHTPLNQAFDLGRIELSFHYGWLRFLITNYAAAQGKPIDEDLLILVIQSYFKEVVHNTKFLKTQRRVIQKQRPW